MTHGKRYLNLSRARVCIIVTDQSCGGVMWKGEPCSYGLLPWRSNRVDPISTARQKWDPPTSATVCRTAGWILSQCQYTVYPKKYAHGFVVLCFVVVMQSFIMNSHEVFIHIHQGCFAGTGAIVRLPQCQWSKPDGYGKISQCITTTKHSKAKTVCIFLGIYCMPPDNIKRPLATLRKTLTRQSLLSCADQP